MYRIGICDDSKYDAANLKQWIRSNRSCPDEVMIDVYTGGEGLLADLDKPFDLIFLDVCMETMDGNKTAERIRKRDESVILVFFSGMVSLTGEQLRYQPFRYINKHAKEELISQYIEEALKEMLRCRDIPFLMVKNTDNGNLIRVRLNEIIFLEIYKHKTRVYLTEGKLETLENGSKDTIFTCEEKMRVLYSWMQNYGFEYAHYSFLVNLKYIVQRGPAKLLMTGGYEISISRSKAAQLNRHFMEFLAERGAR